jgi:hypothetical protein
VQAGNANGVVVDASAAGPYRLLINDGTIVNNGAGDGGGVHLCQTGGTSTTATTCSPATAAS